MKTETCSRAESPVMDNPAGFRITDDERKRVETLKSALAMPVDVETAKIRRLVFVTGLRVLERKHLKKGTS